MPFIETTPEEKKLGLELFFTTTPGIQGRIKKTPEDFMVTERSIDIKPIAESNLESLDKTIPVFTYATVTVRNWETNRLLQVFGRELGISYDRIYFAGTKDKRAITTQLMAFTATPEQVSAIKLDDVEISNIFMSTHNLKIGDLLGNDFEITINEIELTKSEIQERTAAVARELSKLQGYPNFFGVQRFGVIRPITHEVGKLILQRKFEEAVWTYIAHPLEGEPEADYEVRAEFEKCWDFEWALEAYPKHLNFERLLIKYLFKHPEDYTGALSQLPKNLRMMFIHSYQSYLFNRILCERIRSGLPLNTPMIGDLILPVDENKLPVHKTWIPVTEQNQDKITKRCIEGKAFISAVLYGNQTEFASGEFGEIEKKIIEAEGIAPDEFVIPELPSFSSKGNRREILAPVHGFEHSVADGQVKMKFGLIKGTYATSLLREYMKSNIKGY
jgi:tRNA pseudouridine13 synthase